MSRNRNKYKLAVTFEGRDEYRRIAEQAFALYAEELEKKYGVKPKTVVKPGTGERKFDEFTIILA